MNVTLDAMKCFVLFLRSVTFGAAEGPWSAAAQLSVCVCLAKEMPASQRWRVWLPQFIIILRACICASETCFAGPTSCCLAFQISFKCVMYFSAPCLHREAVSDYCQFPYFCQFAVRDVASGFSMRNREKQNKYRTVPQALCKNGNWLHCSAVQTRHLKKALESRPFSPSPVQRCVFSSLSR